jgi:hypothetical protein
VPRPLGRSDSDELEVGLPAGQDCIERQGMTNCEAEVAALDRHAQQGLRGLIRAFDLARSDDQRRLVDGIEDGLGNGVDSRHGADP